MIPDDERCCASVWHASISRSFRCERRGKVKHGDRLYCRQHDPARRIAKEQRDRTAFVTSESNRKDMARLAKQLGAGTPYYYWGAGLRDGGHQRALVISEQEALALLEMKGELARLRVQGRKEAPRG